MQKYKVKFKKDKNKIATACGLAMTKPKKNPLTLQVRGRNNPQSDKRFVDKGLGGIGN